MNRDVDRAPASLDDGIVPGTVAEQTLAWLYNNVLVAAVGGITNYLIVAIVLWTTASHRFLVGWVAVGVLVAGVRVGAAQVFRHRRERLGPRHWLTLHRVMTLLSGLHFALVGLLAFPADDPQRQALIAILTAGMVASAVGFHALDRVSVHCFTVPPTLLIVYRYAEMNTALGIGFAALAVIFVLVMWRAGDATRRVVHRNIELGLSLHYHATHDPLVPLVNRAEFMRRLLASAEDARQPGTALLFIDLDHFKALNDSRGHAVGDDALVRVGSALRDLLRESDVAARMGGDEFVVLLRPATQAAAEHVAGKILHAIEALAIHDGDGRTLSASVGVAWSETGFDPDRLLADADSACYRAKQTGRARVGAVSRRA